uniref:DUF3352 domain-containing protein n=1 Tax=Meloidogyne hapla TaxID=6305 RepID=A0A1I8BB11_MELHA
MVWIPLYFFPTRTNFDDWWRFESVNWQQYNFIGEYEYFVSLNEAIPEYMRVHFLSVGVEVAFEFKKTKQVKEKVSDFDPDPDNDFPGNSRQGLIRFASNSSNITLQNEAIASGQTNFTLNSLSKTNTYKNTGLAMVYIGSEGENNDAFGKLIEKGFPRSIINAYFGRIIFTLDENELKHLKRFRYKINYENSDLILEDFKLSMNEQFNGKLEFIFQTDDFYFIKEQILKMFYYGDNYYNKDAFFIFLVPKMNNLVNEMINKLNEDTKLKVEFPIFKLETNFAVKNVPSVNENAEWLFA